MDRVEVVCCKSFGKSGGTHRVVTWGNSNLFTFYYRGKYDPGTVNAALCVCVCACVCRY